MSNIEVKYNINTLPSAEEMLASDDMNYYKNFFSKEVISSNLETIIQKVKENFRAKKITCISRSNIIYQLTYSLNKEYSVYGKSVINASGMIINNNIGGIPLSKEIITSIVNLNTNYSNICLDYNNTNRATKLSKLINRIFNSESCLVVNNVAAAIFLTLNTIIPKGEIICSSSEIDNVNKEINVERIFSTVGIKAKKLSHQSFCEVNKLYNSVSSETKGVFKVSTGDQTSDPAKLFALSSCAKDKGLMLFELLLSASAFDYSLCNLPFNTSTSKSLKAGVDVLFIPTNKLIGGPESCIIFGNNLLIEKISQNPILAMFLPSNLVLSSLEATLQLYLNKDKLMAELPIFQMLKKPLKEIEIEAHQLLDELKQFYKIDCGIKKSYSQIGYNLLNHIKLPTYVVWIVHKTKEAQLLYNNFTDNSIAVKQKDDMILIDTRCLQYKDYKTLSMVFEQILS